MLIQGGRAVYGETVGILVLDARFPRIHGDVGNARTFDFPVRYKVVAEANVNEIVANADRARRLLPAFISAARELEAEGVGAITTTCGFLTIVQEEIANAVSVPVVTSSLFLTPLVRTMVGGRTIGVVTADAASLSDRHLEAAGAVRSSKLIVRGMEGSPAFCRGILGRGEGAVNVLDAAKATEEVVAVCMSIKNDAPDLAAIIFECTNLQPYAEAAQAATGAPVFGIMHLVEMLHNAVRAPRFDGQI